ncbi:Inheritance of peroxisomes protein 1 [Nakaseomyces bracarensis]|uniref:Inheritance of peroxisomes protein 1 n=1 Tax=Nakaseomyces bracarensis TaxID=273131 RepID=A0ABR4NXM8_9SACH
MSSVKPKRRSNDGKQQYLSMQSIKDTLKLRSKKSSKKNIPTVTGSSANQEAHIKTSSKRLSAHRVTLFKYNNVQVFNCVRANGSRTSSISSSSSSKTVILGTSASTDKLKPLTLIGKGLLELYQIKTPATKERKGQSMNYISLGKSGQIVHPILPKLRITKLREQCKYLITFFNPERFWQIEFLPVNGPSHKNILEITNEFEEVVSNICQLIDDTSFEGETKVSTEVCSHIYTHIQSSTPQSEDVVDNVDEDSELDYLLDDSPSPSEPNFAEIDDINERFKQVLGRISNRDMPNNRRFSSIPQVNHRKSIYRRSVSLFPPTDGIH